VISPNDAFTDVEEKALQWLAAGTRLVLVADPVRRTITAYRGPGDIGSTTSARRSTPRRPCRAGR